MVDKNITPYTGKTPKINWIAFDKNNLPNICENQDFLVLLREDNYDNGATWRYSVDVATPFGSYIDDFWDTTNDWYEGQRVEVVAYAELPYSLSESDDTKWEGYIPYTYTTDMFMERLKKQFNEPPSLGKNSYSVKALQNYDELNTTLVDLTGYDMKKLTELFAAGYTLEPPKYEHVGFKDYMRKEW